MRVAAVASLLALVIGEGNSVADWILTVAACITALGVIHLFLSRAMRFGIKLGLAVDVMLETPSWQKSMEKHVGAMEQRVGAIEEKLGLVREVAHEAAYELRQSDVRSN